MTASTASTPARRSRCCTPGGSSSANVLQPRRRRRRCCRSKVALAAGALLALVCLATAAAGSGGGSSSSSSGGAAAGRGGTAWPTETTAAAAATERAEDDSSGASSSSSGGGGGFTTGAKPRHTPQDAARDAALWRWLEAGGAVVHFAPGYSPGGVRGGFATRDIPAGGVVASIPWRLAYKFPRRWKSFVALGERLALEAADGASFYRPYLESLPSLADAGHTLSWESLPHEYLPLLRGAAPLAERAVAMQAATLRFWARRGLRLAGAGVTLARLRAALVTITTRWYQGPTDGPEAGHMALIPAYDMLNHRNGCPVHYDFAPCAAPGQSPSETCCVVATAAAIRKGEEVCNSYNHLSPDLALFHYGFVLPEGGDGDGDGSGDGGSGGSSGKGAAATAAPPPLSIIDAAGFRPADLRRPHVEPPAPFKGTVAEMAAERERLRRVLALLKEDEPAAERMAPAASDARGEVLSMIRAWRRQRRRALEAEIARLGAAIGGGGGGGEAAARGGSSV